MYDSEPSRMPRLYRVEEAGRILGIGRTKTYELIATGQLWTIHIGRSARVSADELDRFVRAADRPERTQPNGPGRRRTRTRQTAAPGMPTLFGLEAPSETGRTLMARHPQASATRAGGHDGDAR